MQPKRIAELVLCSLLLLGTSVAGAQATTSLGGHVTDSKGAAIVGAGLKLTLTATGTVRSGVTNRSGEYQFQQLFPGRYELDVLSPGFGTAQRTGVDLLVSQPATINIILAIATDITQVTVIAGIQPVLNTTDATIGNAFTAEQVQDLPSLGRNTNDFLSLQPGVAYFGSGTSTLTNDTRSGAVNGGRSDQNNLTLDGIDVNDINNGYAFQPAFRLSQDAVSEFRVTTSNPNAVDGRSSGAQVALVTKSGSNALHGAIYEYNRTNLLHANDFFFKQAQVASGLPNTPAKLVYNDFGVAVGGPIAKNRAFYFFNYDGRRQATDTSSNDVVPTAAFRAGNLTYACPPNTAACTLGWPFLPSTVGYYTLTPTQIKSMDPQGIGANSSVMTLMNSLPLPNNTLVGDGLNFQGYSFIYGRKVYNNSYIARFDWNITPNGRHTAFWRGNLQDDGSPSPPTYPNQPPSASNLVNSRGFAAGYTAQLTSNLVNTAEFGLTRQGGSSSGLLSGPFVRFVFTTPQATTSTSWNIDPVYDLVDNLSWAKHNHNMEFGTNIRLIEDINSNNGSSFSNASGVAGYLAGGGIAGSGGAFDSAAYKFPKVDFGGGGFNGRPSYNNAILALTGILDLGNVSYNATKSGAPLGQNIPVVRDYRWNEYDFYAQDSWKATKDLTFTYGLHYSYQQVPAETTGTQVGICKLAGTTCATGPFSLANYLSSTAQLASSGQTANGAGELGFPLNGRYSGHSDYWTPDKADFGPRAAFAYSPSFDTGLLHKIFGSGKSSIRGGYTLAYDHFGAGVVNSFVAAGSYGLNTGLQTTPGTFSAANAPRFTNINTVPQALLPGAPPFGFPSIPSASGFAISWAEDSAIRSPYAHLLSLSFAREIRNGSSLELSYVGRLSHRLLEQQDVAMPTNLSAAGTTYFAAAKQMSILARANTPIGSVQVTPYWEALFGPLAGKNIGYGSGLSATQNVYGVFLSNVYNETNALYELDLPNTQTNAGINPSQSYPSYRFYHDQYSALYAWRSIGNSNYHALEAVYRQRFGLGLQADVNYTLSKSLDATSQAERETGSGTNNGAQIINTWMPEQLYGPSSFDIRHQLNVNYIWDLPIGRGKRFAGAVGRVTDEVIGGWQTTGIIRWTSGLPYEVGNGNNEYPTNWDIAGFATQVSKVPSGRGQLQQRFADPNAAFAAFAHTFPGESGSRDTLRGDGYFEVDAGLGKTFLLVERLNLKLGMEVFNVSNSVRFDPKTISADLDHQNTFGVASQTLTQARVAQFYGRLVF